MRDPREFLRDKRDGRTHRPEDMRAFIGAFGRGELPEYLASAWLMAAFLNGLDETETDALTEALLHSGRVFDWSALGRPSADKHSTGGVGDKISLILAPLVASCGVLVPMVSGRGLGHTGGTLDKLESVPGFRTQMAPDALRAQLDSLGVAMVGQGPDLAPADGKLYALRDVTATVERDYFIVPSIVSKKIAEGAGALVYDVKCGSGAFMKSRADAVGLAERLVRATRAQGRAAAAWVTDMSQPLGAAVGNALEVREAIDVLRGAGPEDVRELTLELAAGMLRLAGVEPEPKAARVRVERALAGGAAWDKWRALIVAQGGDLGAVEHPERLPHASVVAEARAAAAGRVRAVDTFALGEAVVAMGGGRRAVTDVVDPRVGLVVRRRIGDDVAVGDVLAEVHLAADDDAQVARVAGAFTIAAGPAPRPALVLERVEPPAR
ncbi:MAG TPA: thymidine phosphorylase [Candidatus Saccharimonadaceae bacterium]|nr:thymidine phosphorylase [Candidatus Saccharimonadaceae bacterium]